MADAGIAFRVRDDRAVLALAGADRQRFLHGLVTCEVKALAPGASTYGYFLNGQGRILADVRVVALPEALWLVLPANALRAVAEHLARYVIVDRVEIVERPDLAVVGLYGAGRAGWLASRRPGGSADPASCQPLEPRVPGAAAATAAGAAAPAEAAPRTAGEVPAGGSPAGVVPGSPGEVPPGEMPGEVPGAWLVAGDLAGLDGWLWLLPSAALPAAVAELAAAGGVELGAGAFARRRVSAGAPASGIDFGLGAAAGSPDAPEGLPQELGIPGAVSTTKGCYLGQEIVARIHYRGQVKRALAVLELEPAGGAAAEVGWPVRQEGREIGRLGSVAAEASGRALALALLPHALRVVGTRLEVGPEEGFRGAEVVAVPSGGAGDPS
jgi:folate-binding protein YgfZ